jgi:hypothetical protein
LRPKEFGASELKDGTHASDELYDKAEKVLIKQRFSVSTGKKEEEPEPEIKKRWWSSIIDKFML